MKRSLFIVLTVIGLLAIYPVLVHSQPGGYRGGYGYGMGPGMMGGYGYGMGPGGWVDVPDKLTTPKNSQWVQKLREILVMEKDSLAQYQADQEKFNAYMPSMMIIPQEEFHVQWIQQLFAAYGLAADGKTSPIVQSKTLTEAYELSTKMEKDLLPRYEWLVKNAEDLDTAAILDTALIQSRIHLTMFEHALGVGHGYGFGMRRGFGRGYGMWPGMMGGYGYGYGGMFMWVIFLIVLGLAIYIIMRFVKTRKVTGKAQDTPLDIIKRRYAQKEITKEEFDRMKRDLE